MIATLTRSERRAASRDDARAHPIPAREPSHGLVAGIVHQRHPMRIPFAGTSSGQRRINAKREARKAYWAEFVRAHSVRMRVSVQAEDAFGEFILDSLGNARIVDRVPVENANAVDLYLAILGAPDEAVEASVGFTGYYDPDGSLISARLESIEWFRADGQRIETAGAQS